MSTKNKSRHLHDEEESYYVSMTDLLVGVIFIFIVILMYFALRFQQAEQQRVVKVNLTETANKARREILDDLSQALKDHGIQVDIDEDNGILHLPEDVLFPSGSADIGAAGRQTLGVLANALGSIIPCYTPEREILGVTCSSRVVADIEAIFIEGHTDDIPVAQGSETARRYEDNWGLSAKRAINTFKALDEQQPDLISLLNYNGQAIYSVSGYSQYRPRDTSDTDDARRKNRRIDLRFLMKAPRVEDLQPSIQVATSQLTESLGGTLETETTR